MTRIVITLYLSVVVAVVVPAQTARLSLEDEIRRASRLTLIDTDARVVRDVTIEREALRVNIPEGTMGFLVDHQLRTRGVVLAGKGEFTFLPPTDMERANLRRLKGDTVLRKAFTSVVCLFGDSTRNELERFSQGPGFGSEVRRPLEKALTRLGKKGVVDDPVMVKTFAEGRTMDWFWAYFDVDDGEPMKYRYTPFGEEETQLTEFVNPLVDIEVEEIVSSFHRHADYDTPESERYNAAQFLRIDRVTIDGTFSDQTFKSGLLFEGRATLAFRSYMSRQRWLPFVLLNDLEIDSVTTSAGRSLRWFRHEDADWFWVEWDTVLGPMMSATMTVTYHGTLVERSLSGYTSQGAAHYWFPRHGGMDRAHHDLTFHYPSRLRLAAVGDRVSIETNDDVTTSRWVTPRPLTHISFNIGLFKEFEIRDARIPPVTVYMAEYSHRGLLLSGGDAQDRVAADVANSILFFQNWFGKPPTAAMYATEIPHSHGEAFPGLLHLSWTTFEDKTEEGGDQAFRAHEVAHQWWGIGVTPRSYHDMWLAEGLARYCGWWYVQLTSKDNEPFFNSLVRSKKELLARHRRPESEGRQPWREPSPLWFGYRTTSGLWGGDYERMVYQKGAWIIHMLRNMTVDLQTFDESAFRSVMRTYYTTYAGKTTGTEEFRTIAERVLKTDLKWFFDQWVYGSAMPTYRMSWSAATIPGGLVRVVLRIRQEHVPPGFKMWVPVAMELANGKTVRSRILVDAPDGTYALPNVSERPTKVVLNDLESVLCEVIVEQ